MRGAETVDAAGHRVIGHRAARQALEPRSNPRRSAYVKGAELRHSLRGIAQLNHLSETALVRGLIEKMLGRLPKIEE